MGSLTTYGESSRRPEHQQGGRESRGALGEGENTQFCEVVGLNTVLLFTRRTKRGGSIGKEFRWRERVPHGTEGRSQAD